MPVRDFVVGLDVGTGKVAAVVAQVGQGAPNIIGVGVAPSTGMRKGVVVDIEGTARSVQEAVGRAERMAGVTASSVYLSISGAHIQSFNNRGVVAVTADDKEITEADVQRVIEAARVFNLSSDREIIHVLPREFIVDGYDGVRDPVGMMGVRLEVEAQIVTGAVTSVQNLLRSIYKAGLEVEDVVLAPLASGEAVLQAAEKDLGVVVVDMGAGTTDVAIFEQGSLWYAGVIPLGGDHITNDVAVGLRTPVTQAEKIKIDDGTVLSGDGDADAMVSIPNVGGTGKREVSRKVLASIIEARVREIFGLVEKEIKKSGYPNVIAGGAVLTGGSPQMAGIADLSAEALDLPVRLGMPSGVEGLKDIVSSPPFATAVGLVLFANKDKGRLQAKRDTKPAGSIFSRVRNAFKDLF
ncbi:MAG: cell division protein FtsA [Firmicutes bacterium]|nr:cell division protein FtsA [Bacillota bacterium]